jgi:hypothetical protein
MNRYELEKLAARLNAFCQAGNIPESYRLLLNRAADEAARILLMAGFTTVGSNDRSFWRMTQSTLARACNAKVGGYDLRQLQIDAVAA